jgi:hypothetical protein
MRSKLTVISLQLLVATFMGVLSFLAIAPYAPVAAQGAITCSYEGQTYQLGQEWVGECSKTPGKVAILKCVQRGTNSSANEVVREEDASGNDCRDASPGNTSGSNRTIKTIIGEVEAPGPLAPFVQRGDKGAGGISLFINNAISLFYIIAGIVFIGYVLWGAFDWITSGGEKEKVAGAQKKLTHAFMGFILLAVAFGIINLIGTFTGFSFTQKRTSDQCSLKDSYYFDPRVNQCIHKYYDSSCKDQYEDVERRLCP